MAAANQASEHVRAVGRVVRAQSAALAADWRGRDAAAWLAPSACAGWSVRDVAAHLTEAAINAVPVGRAALAGTDPPAVSMEERTARMHAMREQPKEALAEQFERSVAALFDLLEGADEAALGTTVFAAGTTHTLPDYATQRLVEVALHGWDIRAPAEPAATLDPAAAALMIDYVLGRVGRLASPDGSRGLTATCQLDLAGPSGGPVAIRFRDGAATAARETAPADDWQLGLAVEAAIRLLWGRLDLARALSAGQVQSGGDRQHLLTLNTIFPGR